MHLFRDMPIKSKLRLVICLAGVVVLLISSAAFVLNYVIEFRQNMAHELHSLAQVVGSNSASALVFDDRKAAEQCLTALSAKSHVVFACIYNKSGHIFAKYQSGDDSMAWTPPRPREDGYSFDDNHLVMFQRILLDGAQVGTLFIRHDLDEMRLRLKQYGLLVTLILAVTLVIIILLSNALQRVISEPILSLTQTTRDISEARDYSLRAERHGGDEIGELIDRFNDMLEEIQKRDAMLESKVAARTAELSQANEALLRAKESAEGANRAKGEFLANMSHEIRTPMNAILGFAEILTSNITDDQQREYLSGILSSGKTLLKLINDILDLSKIESGRLELSFHEVNPWQVLSEVQQIFQWKVQEKGLEFKIEIDPALPDALLLDGVRLRQILFNLVGNAAKFTHHGYIKLAAHKNITSEDHSTLELIISVEDTGIGIPPDQIEQVFEAFRQQIGQDTTRYGGTGLGLSITRRLVEMMGGEITVKSVVGQGSVFRVLLNDVKVAARRLEPDLPVWPVPESVIFEPALILVVDDVDLNRSLIKGFLNYPGMDIIEAANGAEAVEAARRYQPNLILMDMKMPVMDGTEATHIIKQDQRLKQIPVVVLTAAVSEEDENKVRKAGCDGFLRKPVSKQELYAELAKFLPCNIGGKKGPKRKLAGSQDAAVHTQKSGSPVPKPMTPEAKIRLDGLIQLLETELTDKWRGIHETFIMSRIEDFARQIIMLGTDYDLEPLTAWGNTLLKQAKTFDMEKLPRTIDRFSDLITEITKLKNS
ncbi:MAG: response regulator [Deltaproteobacteria bacterium]|nr:response regulator [Deltaproteobacteria bacterium]